VNSALTSVARRALLCVVLIAVPAFGRTVRGQVTDKEGRAVPRAAVRLKNLVTLRIRSQITGKDGTYTFTRLDPRMDYELAASHKGKSSGWVRLSRFDEGDERVADLRLE
jgi:C-terminal processing protease CtpA/Prc